MLANAPPGAGEETIYLALCRALRTIMEYPIFTLFLSTAAKFRLFSPPLQANPLRKLIKGDLKLLPPISEISFDDLALAALENTVTLKQVTEDHWMSHLGRPS